MTDTTQSQPTQPEQATQEQPAAQSNDIEAMIDKAVSRILAMRSEQKQPEPQEKKQEVVSVVDEKADLLLEKLKNEKTVASIGLMRDANASHVPPSFREVLNASQADLESAQLRAPSDIEKVVDASRMEYIKLVSENLLIISESAATVKSYVANIKANPGGLISKETVSLYEKALELADKFSKGQVKNGNKDLVKQLYANKFDESLAFSNTSVADTQSAMTSEMANVLKSLRDEAVRGFGLTKTVNNDRRGTRIEVRRSELGKTILKSRSS
jgi:hypothetical protein